VYGSLLPKAFTVVRAFLFCRYQSHLTMLFFLLGFANPKTYMVKIALTACCFNGKL
jgi:hypothetical protein